MWLYGPYTPYTVSAGSQPDWYLGWLDGSVRLWPHWEFRSFGHEIANPFFPGLLIPGLVFTIMYAWPWIDKRIYNDYGPHNLLDRPRDKPFRTGVGVAAHHLLHRADPGLRHRPARQQLPHRLRAADRDPAVSPPWSARWSVVLIAYKACKALQRTDAHPIQRPIGGIIVRTADGAYHTLATITATVTAPGRTVTGRTATPRRTGWRRGRSDGETGGVRRRRRRPGAFRSGGRRSGSVRPVRRRLSPAVSDSARYELSGEGSRERDRRSAGYPVPSGGRLMTAAGS